jgi:DNA-binding IscR family transcriptional regulator
VALPAEVTAKLGNVIRRLSSSSDGEIVAAVHAMLRLLRVCGADIHALAERIENGGISEKYQEEVRAQIKKAHEVGYERGVRAAEARFRPDGKLEFSEVALCVERQINHFPPDKHEFIHKMAFYARQELEPTQKQGKFLFDLFVQYLGGRIT